MYEGLKSKESDIYLENANWLYKTVKISNGLKAIKKGISGVLGSKVLVLSRKRVNFKNSLYR